jgi:hypothetical protein
MFCIVILNAEKTARQTNFSYSATVVKLNTRHKMKLLLIKSNFSRLINKVEQI